MIAVRVGSSAVYPLTFNQILASNDVNTYDRKSLRVSTNEKLEGLVEFDELKSAVLVFGKEMTE